MGHKSAINVLKSAFNELILTRPLTYRTKYLNINFQDDLQNTVISIWKEKVQCKMQNDLKCPIEGNVINTVGVMTISLHKSTDVADFHTHRRY